MKIKLDEIASVLTQEIKNYDSIDLTEVKSP